MHDRMSRGDSRNPVGCLPLLHQKLSGIPLSPKQSRRPGALDSSCIRIPRPAVINRKNGDFDPENAKTHSRLDQLVQTRTARLEPLNAGSEPGTAGSGRRQRGRRASSSPTLSHEIRTPMNAVSALAHLALNSGLDPRQRNYMWARSAGRPASARVINDVSRFLESGSGKMEVDRVEMNLHQVLDNVANLTARKGCRQRGSNWFRHRPQRTGRADRRPAARQSGADQLCEQRRQVPSNGRNRHRRQLPGGVRRCVAAALSVRDTGISLTKAQQTGCSRVFRRQMRRRRASMAGAASGWRSANHQPS